jgi:sensor histidine kinase YesM
MILVFIFSKGTLPITVDYIYTIVFIALLAIPVSINFYLLIPKLLKQERYLVYSLSFVINLIAFAFLCKLILKPILDTLFPNFFFVSYISDENIFLVFIVFLIATTLLKLAEDWFHFNTNENKLLKLKNQQIETQLSTLRAQINPHFLFNSLNVIYALALEKKEGITNAIVQLSDILRYVIYDSNTDQVTLKEEITLLKNYIAFQNHRVKLPDTVNLNIDVEDENFKIYPMLLLPLLENSYKYGIDYNENSKPIVLNLSQSSSNFKFTISNAISNSDVVQKHKHSGVGIENITNNLNLVYPNQHEFKISTSNHQFNVTLAINNDNA